MQKSIECTRTSTESLSILQQLALENAIAARITARLATYKRICVGHVNAQDPVRDCGRMRNLLISPHPPLGPGVAVEVRYGALRVTLYTPSLSFRGGLPH